MKKFFYYSAVIAFLFSCGTATDKKADLEKLKAQRDQLNLQISQLENKVQPSDKKSMSKVATVNVEDVKQTVFNHYI